MKTCFKKDQANRNDQQAEYIFCEAFSSVTDKGRQENITFEMNYATDLNSIQYMWA